MHSSRILAYAWFIDCVCTLQISTERADTGEAYQHTAPTSPVAAVTDADVTDADVTDTDVNKADVSSDALAAKLQAAALAQSDDDVTDAHDNEETDTALAQQ
jgi:hypothetical protein